MLLTIRNIYRVVEFAQGFTGFIAVHELYFYRFDTPLIAGACAIMTVFHPGYLLPHMIKVEGFVMNDENKWVPLVSVG